MDLVADFRLAPAQANPGADRYGHPGVWSYGYGSDLTNPADFARLGVFVPNEGGVPGLQTWRESSPDGPSNSLPLVGINATGGTARVFTVTWPAGVVNMHPYAIAAAIAGWHSPTDGHGGDQA